MIVWCGTYAAVITVSNSWGSHALRAIKGIVMQSTITSDVVVASTQCPRKAYLLLFSPDKGIPHAYTAILAQQRGEHQERYIEGLKQTHADVHPYTVEHLCTGRGVLLHARLQADGL